MTTAKTLKMGDRVSYEDMANPRRYGIVTNYKTFIDFGSLEFEITWDEGDTAWSDCQQKGWRLEYAPDQA